MVRDQNNRKPITKTLCKIAYGYDNKIIWTDGTYRYKPKDINNQGYKVIKNGDWFEVIK